MCAYRVATWNINGLIKHKHDVEILLSLEKIDVLLISEAHLTSSHVFSIKDYCTYSTQHPDGTAHAGTAIVVRKHIKHEVLQEYKTDQLQATSIIVHDKQGSLVLSAVYCPPRHATKAERFSDYFETLGQRFLCGGHWNAKHTGWGSRLTLPRGRELKRSLNDGNIYTLSTGEPSYWPTDPNKIPDLLDFFVYKGLSNLYLSVESCQDSSSVIATISTQLIERTTRQYLCNNKTDFEAFRVLSVRYLTQRLYREQLKFEGSSENK